MQIVHIDGDARRELDVRVNNPSATVDDLAQALDPTRADRALLVDGRPADPDVDLIEAGLHDGAEVRFGGQRAGARGLLAAGDTPAGAPGLELVVVNGLDAGRRFRLGTGTAVVGRAPGCEIVLADATLSRRHAAVTVVPGGRVTVDDLGSHNGTWVAGEPVVAPVTVGEGEPLRLGASELEVRRADARDRPLAFDPLRQVTVAGTIPFNRPPRPAPPPPPAELVPPAPPKAGQGRAPLSLVGILTPLFFAGVMYAVMQSVHMLLFAGLTPLMGIANAVDAQRRGRRTDRSERQRFAREMHDLRERLDALADHERRRRDALVPDPAEIVRRVELPSVRLWERRPGDDDALHLRAGVGDVPWEPPIADPPTRGELPDELRSALAGAAVLAGSPVPVDLSAGGVVGIVGDRGAALALARSLLCQAAALHGPADLPVMVLAGRDAGEAWDWSKWLPHTRDATGAGRMLSADPELSTRMAEARLRAVADADDHHRPPPGARAAGPTLLVVVDDESLTEGRRAPTRALLRGEGGPVAGVVVASTVDRLPAVCTTVVEMTDPDGGADLVRPQAGERVDGLLAAGMADDVARACARALARFEDPELDVVGAGLPTSIRLLPLLDLDECSPEAVLARWASAGVDPRPATPVGVSEDGVFTVDVVADGPHGLVGGTTGSGKSELLRSLVAGLAASVDPDHLTFVLIDFKGGSAFDQCAALPHTVGMVTDLDEHLAERALRCLEAELKHRERVLREVGATDLPDYLRKRLAEPMPRLLVVIDEFATLRSELPQFIDALVGVAQRGRSLGVHMLLATQRPRGAISDNIRANTNMRVALRVQDATGSQDVIDVPDAAEIPRTAPGRAYVRLGPGEIVAIQTALSTGPRRGSSQAPVDVAPFVYGPEPRRPGPGGGPVDGRAPVAAGAPVDGGGGAEPETDLSVLVGAIGEAFARTGRPLPRRPWPDPLSGDVDLDRLLDAARAGDAGGSPADPADLVVPLALADDPEAQSQYPTGWRPGDGNLFVYGIGGSGTTTTLASVALSLARLLPPDDLHLYVLDFGAGDLGVLDPLPHVGAVVLASERERQTRLIRHLRLLLDRRRAMGPAAVRGEPLVVTLVDGWSAMAAEFDDIGGTAAWDAFTRVVADGPEVKLVTVVAADRALAIPGRVASLVRQRWALQLADRNDYTSFGVRGAALPQMVPGRAVVAGTGQVVQIARPADGAAAAAVRLAAAHPPPARAPVRIEPLATEVRAARLGTPAALGARPWHVPVGIAESTRSAASLVVYQGEHALVTGPARSGKSTTLLTIAAVCREARPDVTVVAVAGPRSPLAGDPLVGAVVTPAAIGERLAAAVDEAAGPVLVLVDDAESIDDAGGVLDRLSTSERPDLLFVAAGRNDGIRTGYSHWTRPLRRSKLGVLLRPDVDLDGDILGARLPRRAPVGMVTGRGYLACGGDVQLVQVAVPR